MKTEALLTPHMLASLKCKNKEMTIYDAGCPGLALRLRPSGARSWVRWVRSGNTTRRVTLGSLDKMSLREARDAVRGQSGAVEAKVASPTAMTFGALATLFCAAKTGVYTQRTLGCLRSYLDTQLLPAFGARPLNKITTPDVADWFYRYSKTRSGGANAALIHFTTILTWGKEAGHVPFDLPNPAGPIRKNRRAPRGRMLNAKDLKALTDTLKYPPARTHDAADAIRLMLLTGCRSGEILRLRWDAVRRDRLDLSTTKTGPRTVMLSNVAIAALKERRRKITSQFVFPSPQDKSAPRSSVHAAWQSIKHTAGLPETLRLHDLRHTYASHAILSGESLYMTGKLLGHRDPQSTERYAHLSGTALAAASETIATKIEKLMAGA